MPTFKVYVKLESGDTTIWKSYYLISSTSEGGARKQARKRVVEEQPLSSKANVSIKTSFEEFKH